MENEKETKKKNIKKVVFEVAYWVALALALTVTFCIGAHQSKTWDNIEERLSVIEEKLTNKESQPLESVSQSPVRRNSLDQGADNLRTDAITDLTNTTWHFNDEIDVSNFNYSINFTCNDVVYNEFFGSVVHPYKTLKYINSSTSLTAYKYAMGGGGDNLRSPFGAWQDTTYMDISIINGNDVTNSDLITWFSNNATFIDNTPVTYSPIKINNRYDFRKWFGNVDPLTGIITNATEGNYVFDIGSLEINGIIYDHLIISLGNFAAGNIVTGYDFQNSCYLIMGGSDYYAGSNSVVAISTIWLYQGSDITNTTNRITLYKVPTVGGRTQYESGSFLNPTDSVPASGIMAGTFELNDAFLNWEKYIPSDIQYNIPGLGGQLSVYEALQMDIYNDTYMDFASLTAQSTGGNVFTLLGNAFKALAPILSIQVIPGLPIGLLVCLPLVAGILVVVVKLVRK